ncbi:hypothetical protein THAR02_06036 [Trichoderma harzianum]|uniref:Repressor of RNA polymerase III transcription MAF1 n=1 Tax=Trichoderma harzianum TaxID=5544 RepID=A0A0F9X9J3_TRIHA|nr:hypothetical protein THAR02_06036 [Trichoderma harzianum]
MATAVQRSIPPIAPPKYSEYSEPTVGLRLHCSTQAPTIWRLIDVTANVGTLMRVTPRSGFLSTNEPNPTNHTISGRALPQHHQSLIPPPPPPSPSSPWVTRQSFPRLRYRSFSLLPTYCTAKSDRDAGLDCIAALLPPCFNSIAVRIRDYGPRVETEQPTSVTTTNPTSPSSAPLCATRTPKQGDTYLPVQEFEAVTGALNFNTPDCNVTGGCDLYTTKSTGSDKKLYKNIDKDLSSQHAALLKLGASLSPPDREHMLATSRSMQLFSHSSAFGPLSELSSRRTFAYLIATLNASHPHYDFSHVLRPGDFKRERNLKRVMANLDSILQNTRPGFDLGSSYDSSAGSDVNAQWGPQCWSLINKEMRLNECTIFSYHPEVDPFEEDESAIWAVHYFFFNRALKRVAYLYVRVVPVISSQSPTLRPVKGGVHKRHTAVESDGAKKRTKYWLGDQDAELVPPYEDDEEPLDDGLYWNRGEDGDIVQFSDDDFAEDEPVDEDEDEDDDYDMTSPRRERLMSEDVAGQMEI